MHVLRVGCPPEALLSAPQAKKILSRAQGYGKVSIYSKNGPDFSWLAKTKIVEILERNIQNRLCIRVWRTARDLH